MTHVHIPFHTLHLSWRPASPVPRPLHAHPSSPRRRCSPAARRLLRDGRSGGLAAAPVLNTSHTHYFTGRSDNFDPTQLSTNPTNARLDPEGIRVSRDGESVFISDEYGPYVYQFDRVTGRRLKTFTLPNTFAVTHLSSVGAEEISGNIPKPIKTGT
jgi:hypothetical protein